MWNGDFKKATNLEVLSFGLSAIGSGEDRFTGQRK